MPDKVVETPEEQIANLKATNTALKDQVEDLNKQLGQYAKSYETLAMRYQNLLELYNGLFEQYITKGTAQKK